MSVNVNVNIRQAHTFDGRNTVSDNNVNITETDLDLLQQQPFSGVDMTEHTSPLSNESCKSNKRVKKVWKWKKDKTKPKRPLSAYNLFFADERQKMLDNTDNQSKAFDGFAGMARAIGAKWKTLDEHKKAPFKQVAALEQKRYKDELAKWTNEKQSSIFGPKSCQDNASEGSQTKPILPKDFINGAQRINGHENLSLKPRALSDETVKKYETYPPYLKTPQCKPDTSSYSSRHSPPELKVRSTCERLPCQTLDASLASLQISCEVFYQEIIREGNSTWHSAAGDEATCTNDAYSFDNLTRSEEWMHWDHIFKESWFERSDNLYKISDDIGVVKL